MGLSTTVEGNTFSLLITIVGSSQLSISLELKCLNLDSISPNHHDFQGIWEKKGRKRKVFKKLHESSSQSSYGVVIQKEENWIGEMREGEKGYNKH